MSDTDQKNPFDDGSSTIKDPISFLLLPGIAFCAVSVLVFIGYRCCHYYFCETKKIKLESTLDRDIEYADASSAEAPAAASLPHKKNT